VLQKSIDVIRGVAVTVYKSLLSCRIFRIVFFRRNTNPEVQQVAGTTVAD